MARVTKERYIEEFKKLCPDADDALAQISYACYLRFSGPEFSDEDYEKLNSNNCSKAIIYGLNNEKPQVSESDTVFFQDL